MVPLTRLDDAEPLLALSGRVSDRLSARTSTGYAFLGNLDRHLHVHVLPRYASARRVPGIEFVDRGYPGHYALSADRRALPSREEHADRHQTLMRRALGSLRLLVEHDPTQPRQSFVPARTNLGNPLRDFI